MFLFCSPPQAGALALWAFEVGWKVAKGEERGGEGRDVWCILFTRRGGGWWMVRGRTGLPRLFPSGRWDVSGVRRFKFLGVVR